MDKKNPEYLGLEITKSKTDQCGKTAHVYITKGKGEFTPAASIISLAAKRIKAGEEFDFDSPIFAYHQKQPNGEVEVIPLTYETVLRFDKERSKLLGLPSSSITSHC